MEESPRLTANPHPLNLFLTFSPLPLSLSGRFGCRPGGGWSGAHRSVAGDHHWCLPYPLPACLCRGTGGRVPPLLSLRDLSSLFDGRGVGRPAELSGGWPVPVTRRLTPPRSLQLGGCGGSGSGLAAQSSPLALVTFSVFLKTKGFGPSNFFFSVLSTDKDNNTNPRYHKFNFPAFQSETVTINIIIDRLVTF